MTAVPQWARRLGLNARAATATHLVNFERCNHVLVQRLLGLSSFHLGAAVQACHRQHLRVWNIVKGAGKEDKRRARRGLKLGATSEQALHCRGPTTKAVPDAAVDPLLQQLGARYLWWCLALRVEAVEPREKYIQGRTLCNRVAARRKGPAQARRIQRRPAPFATDLRCESRRHQAKGLWIQSSSCHESSNTESEVQRDAGWKPWRCKRTLFLAASPARSMDGLISWMRCSALVRLMTLP